MGSTSVSFLPMPMGSTSVYFLPMPILTSTSFSLEVELALRSFQELPLAFRSRAAALFHLLLLSILD